MIIEYDQWPKDTRCCECGCTDETIDFVPTVDDPLKGCGDWICFECLSRQHYDDWWNDDANWYLNDDD